ncbi:glutathione peroxidase [Olivibacter domesticus]|uniref:Glutathione peroxidase n=1 Tax=Olivibacter domesticus TaxID=407022 RepID=A0A1H7LBY4_OLID1|nr:glutathione peroxidase [Olivibacter domesticus]SEK96452.1 glutathione peroxidase [Olivibacter domesticus]
MNKIYQFCAMKPDGSVVDFNIYENKVLLIVNTASACGFTPQYKELEVLYKQFNHRGFEVLAFPSNDFGQQEQLSGKALETYCSIDQKLSFTVYDRIKVKGQNAHPLYKFLGDKWLNGKTNSKPFWNFHKYLINREGVVVDYFYSFTKPLAGRLVRKIEALL